MAIRIDQDRLFRWLFGGLLLAEVTIVLLDAFVNEYRLAPIGAARRLFNITREDGLANFFSSFQMLGVGAVLMLITMVVKRQTQGSNSKVVVGWGVITGLFVYMGVDDGTKLHERLGSIFKALVTDSSSEASAGMLGRLYEAFPSYTWQLVLGPFVAVFGLFLVLFLIRELPSLRLKAIAMLAIMLLVVAMSMDFIEGMDNGLMAQVAEVFSTETKRAVHFSKSIEEFLEMVATTTFLFVFLKTLMSLTSSITFEVTPRQ